MHIRKPKETGDADLHTHYELGVLAQEFGRYRKAVNEYKKEIAETGYYKAHYNLGTILEEKRRYAEAIREFRTVIKKIPDFYLAYNYLGIIHAQRKEHAKSIQAHTRAIQLNTKDSMLFTNLGLAYDRAGKFDEAIKAFRKALALSPNNRDALLNLGDLLVGENIAVSEGLKVLQKANRVAPDNPRVLASLAIGHLGQGCLRQALRLAGKAKELAPSDQFVLDRVRMVESQSGERDLKQKKCSVRVSRMGRPTVRRD